METPKGWQENWKITSMLSTVGNTSKDLVREIAIKSTKSLLNLGDELFVDPQKMSIYLKKLKFSDAIVDAAMRQAWFTEETMEAPKEEV